MEVDGVVRQMDVIADTASTVDKALARFGKYLRLKAQRRFDSNGPGWPPLKAATQLRHEAKASRRLESKLRRDVIRATRTAKKDTTRETRETVLAEFKRLEAGGMLDKSLLTPKQQKSLQGRIGRAKKKAGEKLLGKIAGSLKAKISNNTLTVIAGEKWAHPQLTNVHNEGGSANHGANIPKREFLKLEGEDLSVLEAFIVDAVEEEIAGLEL